MPSPVSARHQKITNFLVSLLSTFAQLHSSGEVLNGPFQMKLKRTGREPDIVFIFQDHLGRLKSTYLDGLADLAVEVVSPESQERDRAFKFYEYQDTGISEYWLIDPTVNEAIFYQLDTTGHYQAKPPDEQGIYRSQVLPGFWLRVAWLWQEPLPKPSRVLLEIDRDAYAKDIQEDLRQAGIE